MSWKDRARRRAKERSSGDRYKLVEGENTFRILPNKNDIDCRSTAEEDSVFAEFRMHYSLGPSSTARRCGKDIDGVGKCWLCDVIIPKLQNSRSDDKQKQARRIAPKDVLVIQIAPVEDGKFQKPLFFWSSAQQVATPLLDIIGSNKRSYYHPVKGYNLTIQRTGTGLKTTYGAPFPEDEPSRVPKAILAAMKDLSEAVPAYSKNALKTAFYGESAAALDDEDEDEEPREGAEPDEDDEELDTDEDAPDEDEPDEDEPDEDEDLDEDEPDEDEPDEDDEDEPDEDEPDEDEEPAPKKRTPRRAAKPAPKKTVKKTAVVKGTRKRRR